MHTTYSPDSVITPEELIACARKLGLDGVAVTDHDTLEGALKIASETDFLVIPGMEIESSEGHIVALDISKPVSKKLGADETVEKIHEAGGIAVACHPVTFFKGSLGKHAHSKFDAVEAINASAIPFRYSVKQGMKLAERLGVGSVAGSDAHYAPEIGRAYTIVNAEPKIDDVIDAIRKGACEPFGKAIPWTLRLKKIFLLMRMRFR